MHSVCQSVSLSVTNVPNDTESASRCRVIGAGTCSVHGVIRCIRDRQRD